MNGPHKRLELWKEAMNLCKLIYGVSKGLPEDEKFGMTSQLKRAAVSVPANVAEGAARQTKKEFKQFLFIARGSLSELDTLLELSRELDFEIENYYQETVEKLNKVNALLNGLLKSIG
tara:strand:+ start:1560 stop:1913 length:354 start_codon:yes stop_codon:yes gene_type:complete